MGVCSHKCTRYVGNIFQLFFLKTCVFPGFFVEKAFPRLVSVEEIKDIQLDKKFSIFETGIKAVDQLIYDHPALCSVSS